MMTVSHPGPHFSGNRAALKQKPHFSGKAEQQQFIEKLKGFPTETHERLEQIYHLRGNPAHIDLAHELEEKDEHIKWFNATIADKSQPEQVKDLRTAVSKFIRERLKEKGQAQQLDVQA